ncbi:MAG: VCBS repeat-containing protein [Bacteroidia bacterium]|nr:VCBS repeat-containing protein [Bacteroidia bacterium]
MKYFVCALSFLAPLIGFSALPVVTNFEIATLLNTDYVFSQTNFNNAYVDTDGDLISAIRITNIPIPGRGQLIYDGSAVVYADMPLVIPFADIAAGRLLFRPATGYEGTCNFRWNASDGASYALRPDYFTAKIGNYLDGCTAEMPRRIKSISLQKSREFTAAGTNAYVTPFVGDFNGDGETDALSCGSVIRILDPKQTSTASATLANYTPNPVLMSGGNASSVATGDLFTYNNTTNTVSSSATDGLAEIVYYGNGDKLVCLTVTYDGSTTDIEEVWEITLFNPLVADRSTIAIHDLNNDGIAEIICAGGVYSSQTGAFLLDLFSVSAYRGYGYKTAIFSTVAVYDVITGVSGNEIMYGHEVLSTVITNNSGTAGNSATLQRSSGMLNAAGASTLTDGVVSLADMDLDGDVDAVVSARGYVYVWDIQSAATLLSTSYYNLPDGGDPSLSGQAVISDFDNDGIPEFALVSNLRLTVFEDILNAPTLTELWQTTTTDASGVTNIVSFDLFGTGESVIAYRDETSIRIFNGATDDLLYSEAGCTSATGTEGPTIVDVDDDGVTEIVCSCVEKIIVFEPTITPWKPARSVWNQNTYNVINVDDAMGITGSLNNNHTTAGLNSFQAQQAAAGAPGGTGIAAYDLSISTVSVNTASCPGTVDIT